jgi:hypothetical protein
MNEDNIIKVECIKEDAAWAIEVGDVFDAVIKNNRYMIVYVNGEKHIVAMPIPECYRYFKIVEQKNAN